MKNLGAYIHTRSKARRGAASVLPPLIFLLAFIYPPATGATRPLPEAGSRGFGDGGQTAAPDEPAPRPSQITVRAVDAVGMTVANMDRSLDFYSRVLSFEKVSDVEVTGSEYEYLQGIFGLRMRIVRMRLGGEFVELVEYLVPRGRPIPADSRSNDR